MISTRIGAHLDTVRVQRIMWNIINLNGYIYTVMVITKNGYMFNSVKTTFTDNTKHLHFGYIFVISIISTQNRTINHKSLKMFFIYVVKDTFCLKEH